MIEENSNTVFITGLAAVVLGGVGTTVGMNLIASGAVIPGIIVTIPCAAGVVGGLFLLFSTKIGSH